MATWKGLVVSKAQKILQCRMPKKVVMKIHGEKPVPENISCIDHREKILLSVVTILLHRASDSLPNEIVWQLSKLLDPSALRLKTSECPKRGQTSNTSCDM